MNVIRSAYAVVETKDNENGTVKNNTSYAINSGSFIVTAQPNKTATKKKNNNKRKERRERELGGPREIPENTIVMINLAI